MTVRGYIYTEIEITNPDEYEHSRAEAPDTIAAYGGRFIVQRGDPKPLAGSGEPRLVMILEFDGRDEAAK